ncbi:hypothetical protein ABEF95_017097 [Exophiala dermatitidis]
MCIPTVQKAQGFNESAAVSNHYTKLFSGNPVVVVSPQRDRGNRYTALEISIDTVVSRPPVSARAPKPVKIRLPPYNHSLHLIQVLESAIGHQQHYFRRRDIRAKVAQMHQSPDSPQSRDQGWLCHWLALVALGELYSSDKETHVDPQDPLGPAVSASLVTPDPPGAEYYYQSVSLLQQVAENPDVQYIETLCLLALYAFSMNRVNTAYMYVGVSMRAALSLDLHRSPFDFPSERSTLSPVELEHQKRLYWTVYYQDLLTTSTSGRPWGVLDDEITVDYADSSRLSGEALSEFFDAEESNIHLELMRLRSQAYSSLYGYAGTAINPYSHISLFDFELSRPLSQQHLDKICEFHQALLRFENELPVSMKMVQAWDGSRANINRVNAHLYLIYHQSILVLLRPALVNAYNDWFHAHTKNRKPSTTDVDPQINTSQSRLHGLYTSSVYSAREVATILQWLRNQGAFSTYAYFTASFAFTAAITLYIARALSFSPYHEMSSKNNFAFTAKDHSALDTTLQLLGHQIAAGNAPAISFGKLLRLLDSNLQALQAAMQNPMTLPVDIDFSTPNLSFADLQSGPSPEMWRMDP